MTARKDNFGERVVADTEAANTPVYKIEFERISRNRAVEPLLVSAALDEGQVAAKVLAYARRFCASNSFGVTVELPDDKSAGRVWIEGGRFGEGTIRVVAQ
jgi:hypothetical protein